MSPRFTGEDPGGAVPDLGRVTQSIDATKLMLDFFDEHRTNGDQ